MFVSNQIRRFPFFEFKEVVDKSTKNTFSLLKGVNLACATSGRGLILIGDSTGVIYALNKFLNSFFLKFSAFNSCVNFLLMSKKYSYIYSVGTDMDDIGFYLRIFDTNKVDNVGIPLCLKNYKINTSNEQAIVSSFNVLENQNVFVFGFTNGLILIVKGSISLKDKKWKTTEIKHFTVAITNLEFLVTDDRITLFITTLESISCIDFQANSFEVKTIETFGCDPNCCSTMNTPSNKETFFSCQGIYSFTSEGRAQYFPVEGQKGILRVFNNNIVYTIRNPKFSGISNSNTANQNVSILNIITLDEKIKYISFTKSIPDLFEIVYVWNSMYVITSNGQLFELIESNLEKKIDILFNVNMFDLAISLARRTANANLLNEVICKYGDSLYSKGNVEDAMNQYMETIGILEPSYVIRKYLDAQNIQYLISYLECLHKKKLASSDHTTLLINCYIRLKDVKKLDLFLKSENDYHFDVETALAVCHQAGFFEHALHLAKKTGSHGWYLKIQLDDVQDYKSALDYIKKLDIDEAQKVLKNYGRRLLTASPLELIEYLKFICTFSENNLTPCNAENFIHIFIHQREYLQPFLEYIILIHPDSSKLVYNTLIEIYLYELTNSNQTDKSNIAELEAKCLKILEFDQGKYDDDHALMLCQLNHFIKGLVFLFEKSQKYNLILQYHFSIKDFEAIINDCKKYGKYDLSLWSKSLSFFAMNIDLCENHLNTLIAYIDEKDIIPPVSLINALSKSNNISISTIKDMMSNTLKKETITSKEGCEKVLNLEKKIQEVNTSIELIKSGKKTILNSKCDLCSKPLELPVAHFLCGHSYHRVCIDVFDQENSCLKCTSDIQSLRANFESVPDTSILIKSFEKDLQTFSNPVLAIQKYMKYGLFNTNLS